MITLFNIRPYGFNVGNGVIAQGMQQFLQEAFGSAVNIISLPATSKYEAGGKGGLTAQSIYEINQYGDGVIIGGGNLYENGELQIDQNALKALLPPMMIFSVSSGRIYMRQNGLMRRTNAMPEAAIQAVNTRADLTLARDKATFDYLRSLGIGKAQLGGCPTIFLNEGIADLPKAPAENQNLILIPVRHPQLMSIPPQAQARVQGDIQKIIDQVKAAKLGRVMLVCHDQRDIAFAASFASTDYLYFEDVGMFLSTIRAAKLVISYRLHATLPAFSYGVPAISISYDERALSLIETIGLKDWDINMIETPDVAGEVTQRLANMARLDYLKQHAQPVWQDLKRTMQSAFAEFAGRVQTFKAIEHIQSIHFEINGGEDTGQKAVASIKSA